MNRTSALLLGIAFFLLLVLYAARKTPLNALMTLAATPVGSSPAPAAPVSDVVPLASANNANWQYPPPLSLMMLPTTSKGNNYAIPAGSCAGC